MERGATPGRSSAKGEVGVAYGGRTRNLRIHRPQEWATYTRD